MKAEPEFEEIAGGDDLAPEEAARLRHVHDLLVAAGPPPELSPGLAKPPRTPARVSYLPDRRRGAWLLLAAAVAAAFFGAGYLANGGGPGTPSFSATRVVSMRATGHATAAFASIQVGERDPVGNWPLVVRVRGLKPLPDNTWYELYLTRKGKIVAPCGTFSVRGSGATVVRFSVPYALKRFDGWVVTTYKAGDREPGPVLLTT